jgi:AcrR family transcriptional regulator
VAAEAGVSRPTLYAHFADRHRLIAALVARAVRDAVSAIDSAEPDRGPAVPALRRVVGASWEHLARHQEIARAATSDIPHDELHAAHREVLTVLGRLVERGRDEGAFRRDLPAAWLAVSSLALINSAASAVWSGQMDPPSALQALMTTIEDICVRHKRPRTSTRR